jgi:uncharacterized protein (TIGR03435 family)
MARELISIITALFIIGAAVQAEPQAPPRDQTATAADVPLEFEVATIKINKSGDTATQFDMVPGSGRVAVINMQLRGAIQSAYRVPADQLEVPDWVNRTRVDIVAKADPRASVQQLQTMIQPLLVERLKLTFHNETRERDIYALVLANADGRLGPKLKVSATDCAALGAAPRNTLQPTPEGQAPACGLIPSGPGRIVARGFGIGPLVSILNIGSKQIGRQIIDQTGLKGGYDIDLAYTPDALSAGALANRQGAPLPAAAGQVDPNGPGLFQALHEQLGLKVEPRKQPLQIMVVDRIEPPGEE